MNADTLCHPAETKTIHYKLDDEPQQTHHEFRTPTQIMEEAKPAPIDPATHYLVQLKSEHHHHQESYKDKPDERIHMHQHAKFVAVSTGPTPVS